MKTSGPILTPPVRHPAGQRFHATNRTRSRINKRLERNINSAGRQCRPQLCFEVRLSVGVFVEAVFELDRHAATKVLGAIERDIGTADELDCLDLARRRDCDTDTGADFDRCCGELDQTFVGGEGRRSIFSIAITSDPPSNECEQLA
jgi:hypothetical protein